MPSLIRFLCAASTVVAAVHAQGVIQSAQGTKGSPASLPLQINLQATDANIINNDEITANIVNECGRTTLAGNIDVGANTEDQLANKTVTSVTKGSTVAVTIKQGGTDGAGPYTCDMDLTSNSNGVTGQTALTVKETDNKDGTISLSVTMPKDMACVGASTGTICTVRCRNAAATGPFGGCFAVQQTDTTPNANTPATIATAQTLKGVTDQIAENIVDLPAAVKANQDATEGTDAQQGVLQISALLGSVEKATAVASVVSSASATATAKAGKKGGNGNGNNKNARRFFS